MTTYKISNITGRFDHVTGKTAAVARANEIQGTVGIGAAELERDYGWTISRISKTDARAVGL